MSLIEKIDAEIKDTEKFAKEYIGIGKREVLLCASSKISMAKHIRELILSEQKETCNYIQYDKYSNTWECSRCGGIFQLNYGSPNDNNIEYCQYCGKEIKENIIPRSSND